MKISHLVAPTPPLPQAFSQVSLTLYRGTLSTHLLLLLDGERHCDSKVSWPTDKTSLLIQGSKRQRVISVIVWRDNEMQRESWTLVKSLYFLTNVIIQCAKRCLHKPVMRLRPRFSQKCHISEPLYHLIVSPRAEIRFCFRIAGCFPWKTRAMRCQLSVKWNNNEKKKKV